MQLGTFIPATNPFHTPEVLSAFAEQAEARGVASIWVPEHVVLFGDYDSSYPYAEDGRIPAAKGTGILEPFTLLSFLAARTTTVRLATGICLLPQRNPVYTAKEAAAVDWLSGGRFDFGIGVGWLEEEFRAVDVGFARRGARTDEYLDLIEHLWSVDDEPFAGEFYDLPATRLDPKPVQSPHPPFVFGGESTAALRRVARRGQGWHSFNRTPDTLAEPLASLDRLLDEHGRTRDELTVTCCPYFHGCTPEMVEGFAEHGVDQVTVMVFPTSLEEVEPAFEAIQPLLDRAAAC